jgi:acetyl esterase/lipase
VASYLSKCANATVVQVNYRYGSSYRYPTPIHDVLSGYDWVMSNLLGSSKTRRIGVCGELLGGSLATMLALTECRLGSRRVECAAVNNAIFDWLFLDSLNPESPTSKETSASSKRKKPTSWEQHQKDDSLSALDLMRARSKLFGRPQDLFDRFASPIHFFRSPGAELPPQLINDSPALTKTKDSDETPPTYDGRDLPEPPSDSDIQYSYEDDAILTNDQDIDSVKTPQEASTGSSLHLLKRRKYHRAHPPKGSGLVLPRMLISGGTDSLLLDQSEEFVRLMRRSVSKEHLQNLSLDFKVEMTDDAEKTEEIVGKMEEARKRAERRVQWILKPGHFGWAERGKRSDGEWKEYLNDAGSWFRNCLLR